MKHAFPHSQVLYILGLLIENERLSGRKFIPRDDPAFLRFYDQRSLPHILDTLESQGYITQHRMRVGDIHNIRLTDAGRAYFQNQADRQRSLWLQFRFNLLQAAIIAAIAFLAGLVCEHWLQIVDALTSIVHAALQLISG